VSVPLALLLNGWALVGWGAALTSIPIIIHLLNRRRVRVVRWAAMAWLLAALKRHQRRLRLENWLVLALRVAAILLLGLALARPVLTDSALAGLTGQKRSVYIVLDTSGSTGARREARAVSDTVKAEAGYVLAGLSSEDAFAVVVSNDAREEASTGREPAVLVPRTAGSSAVARAREQVAALPVRDAAASWRRTLMLVRAQLADEDVNRQVVIVTDLTARDWTRGSAVEETGEPLRDLVRRGCRVRVVDVGGPLPRRANLAVTHVDLRSDRAPFQGRSVPLSVRVANWGAEPVTGALVTVEVSAGGVGGGAALGEAFRRMRAAPVLPAADPATGEPGRALVDLDVPPGVFLQAGSYLVKASIGPPPARPTADVLSLDSVRYVPLEVRERVRVLAWTRTSQGARFPPAAYLRPAFDPLPPTGAAAVGAAPPVFEMAHIEGEAESIFAQRLGGAGRGVDLVVLANVLPRNPAVQDALRAFVREGGALLVFTGDLLEPALANDVFAKGPPEQRLLPYPLLPAELRPERARPRADPWHFRVDVKSPAPWAGAFTGPDVATWLALKPPLVRGRTAFDIPPPVPAGGSPGRPPPIPAPPGPSPEPGAPAPPAPPVAPAAPVDDGIVLRWDEDGTPAVVETRLGLGRALWVGTTLDDGWMTNGVPFFLPVFLEEAALHLTQGDEPPRAVEVGEVLETVLPRGAAGEHLVAPGGKDVPLTRSDAAGGALRPRVEASQTGFAGPWRLTWKTAEGAGVEQGRWFAVNPDPAEGALAPADRSALQAAAGPDAPLEFLDSYKALRTESETTREGDISRLILLVVLGVLVLESLLAWWLGRRAGGDAAAHAAAEPGAGVA
jgi:hypothetical protein